MPGVGPTIPAVSQLERVLRSIRRPERICVGLLSGTSVDAAEAVVCRIRGSGGSARLRLLSHVSVPFPEALIQRILGAQRAEDICQLNFELGEAFAAAAKKALRRARLTPGKVDLIGSHGQTLAHLPRGVGRIPSTLQVGEASVIAQRTGIPTVSDFRVADMAAGGEGAPLVPYADWVMFRKPGAWRGLLNVGGIANLSVVGSRLEDTLAFDTGPGNMMLDVVTRRITRGAMAYDKDGQLAARGKVDPTLLAALLRHPFLRKKPPKSTGREMFGEAFVEPLWKKHGRAPLNLLATLTAFTVESIARAFETSVFPTRPIEALYVSGGGARNPLLLGGLHRRLSPLPVKTLDTLGFPEGAKEAACFALLASEWLSGQPQNVPVVTGAKRPVVLGKLSLQG